MKRSCFCCGNAAREEHHVKPRRAGGRDGEKIWLCGPCHDLVDRIPLKAWPQDFYMEAFTAEWPPMLKRLMLKCYAIGSAAESVPPAT